MTSDKRGEARHVVNVAVGGGACDVEEKDTPLSLSERKRHAFARAGRNAFKHTQQGHLKLGVVAM